MENALSIAYSALASEQQALEEDGSGMQHDSALGMDALGRRSLPYAALSPIVRNVSHEIPLGSSIHPLFPRA